uniref:Large ribosomal subunit protein uL22c n=1 Tax=Cyanidium sp. THAL103 TaxID=3027999 RepID=A0A9Y1I488_9RHOD|nr:ribosomal protein L22 [Cyanidium sp. THAL103]
MSEKLLSPIEIKTTHKFIRMSPQKIRRVTNQMLGMNANKAMSLLKFLPYRCSTVVLNLLKSGMCNIVNNYDYIDKSKLYIKNIIVDRGPILKRLQPRAQGKSYPIKKPISHLTIVISVTNK